MAHSFGHVSQLGEQARAAETQAGKLATRATTLPDLIKESLTKKFTTANPLVAQRESALEGFLTAGQEPITAQQFLPEGQGEDVIFSPSEVRRIQSQRRASSFTPLSTANLLLGAGLGGIPNVVTSAVNAFQAQVLAAQQSAQTSRQSYVDALNELMQRQQIELQKRQLAQERELELQRIAIARQQAAASAGGGGLGDLASLFGGAGGSGGGAAAKEQPIDVNSAFSRIRKSSENYNQAKTIINNLAKATAKEKQQLINLAQKWYGVGVKKTGKAKPAPKTGFEAGARSFLGNFPTPIAGITFGTAARVASQAPSALSRFFQSNIKPFFR